MQMDKLPTYVAVIHGQRTTPTVVVKAVEKTSWQDQGFEVTRVVTEYEFANAVVVRHTVERDDLPSEVACVEEWITYEVIASGSEVAGVSPARQTFSNACREAFWLKYHTA